MGYIIRHSEIQKEQRVHSHTLFADIAKLLDVFLDLLDTFLEINEIIARAQTVDTRPSLPPLQWPGYEARY